MLMDCAGNDSAGEGTNVGDAVFERLLAVNGARVARGEHKRHIFVECAVDDVLMDSLDERVVDGGIPVVGHEKRNLTFVPLLEVIETGDTFGFENESGKAMLDTGYVLV